MSKFLKSKKKSKTEKIIQKIQIEKEKSQFLFHFEFEKTKKRKKFKYHFSEKAEIFL